MGKFLSLHDYILEEQAKSSRKDGYWIPVDTMNKLISGIMISFDKEIKNLKDEILSKKRTFPKRGVFDVLKNWWYNAIYGSRNLKNPYYHRNTLGHLGTFSKNEMTLNHYKILKEYADELESKLLTEQRYYIEDIIDQWANRFRYELENTLRDTIRLMYKPTEPIMPPPKGQKSALPSAPAVTTPAPVTAPSAPIPPAPAEEEYPDVPPADEMPAAGEADTLSPEEGELDATEEMPDEEETTAEEQPSGAEGEFPESEPVDEQPPEEEQSPAATASIEKTKEDILNDINKIVYSFDILDPTQTKVDKNKMQKRLQNFQLYHLAGRDDDYVMDMAEREFVIKQLFRYYQIAAQKDLPSKKLEARSPEELENILNMLNQYVAQRTHSSINGLITKLLKIMPWPDMSESYFKKMMSVGVRKKAQPSPDFKKLFENTTLYERTLVCLEQLRSAK